MRCAVAVLLACASACTVAGPPTTPTTGTSSTFAPGSCGKHFSICGDGDSISVFQSEPCDDYETSVNVQIQSLHVDTIIQARYALTKMTSVVKNGENSFHTFNFTFVVPESAKISEIILNENSYYYTSTATEREVGTPSVTDVGVSVREATRIVVRLSLDPLAEVKLILKYEELLIRRLSKYTYKVHLEPGEVVPDLQVNVQIREPVNLGFAETHAFTNDVNTAKENTATTTFTNGDADIFYNPSITEQIETATSFGGNPMSGLKGYLSVSYDVDRGSQGGELYVHENWFVHFFAPALSGPIAKHALFVLDVSGSMAGKKIEQLKSALSSILSNLRDSDIFTVIEFSSTITVWNLDGIDDSSCHSYAATNSRITAAQTRARRMTASGGTSMKTGLLTGLQCAKLIQSNKVDPILVVLTDGQPTDGTPDVVINAVTASNTYNTHIFSLAFGKDANVNFLRRLSNNNGGEAHVIYEGDDAESQLEDFYRSISTPLLLNVAVEYDEDYVSSSAKTTTRTSFDQYFQGSELVIAGYTSDVDVDQKLTLSGLVKATGANQQLHTYQVKQTVLPDTFWQSQSYYYDSPIERLRAFLKISQLLEDGSSVTSPTPPAIVATPTRRGSSTASRRSSTRASATTPNRAPTTTPSTTTSTSSPISGPTSTTSSTVYSPYATEMALQYGFVTPSTCLQLVNYGTTSAPPTSAKPTTGADRTSIYESTTSAELATTAIHYGSVAVWTSNPVLIMVLSSFAALRKLFST